MSEPSSSSSNVTTQVAGNVSIHAENVLIGQGDITSSSQAALILSTSETNISDSEKCLYQMNRITEKVHDQTGTRYF